MIHKAPYGMGLLQNFMLVGIRFSNKYLSYLSLQYRMHSSRTVRNYKELKSLLEFSNSICWHNIIQTKRVENDEITFPLSFFISLLMLKTLGVAFPNISKFRRAYLKEKDYDF